MEHYNNEYPAKLYIKCDQVKLRKPLWSSAMIRNFEVIV